MFSWLFWNPDPVCFTLPYFDRPVMWYGICWAIGFFVALFLTKEVVSRFFCYYPEYILRDILHKERLGALLRDKFGIEGKNFVSLLNGLLLKERLPLPKKRIHRLLVAFSRKRLRPHALHLLINRLYLDELLGKEVVSLRKRASALSEKGWVFIAVGTVIGARIGHLLFYHYPSEYLLDPLLFFRIWEGGLASHGAVVGILLAVCLWTYLHKKEYPFMRFIGWLDLASIPVLFGCAMIRIGNFWNQELLGVVSRLPWAIIFGNPEDGGLPQPRHPVQLYEALLYLVLMCILYSAFFRKSRPLKQGALAGILLFTVFAFRFILEFWKEKQGVFDPFLVLHTGQLLSIPCVIIGLALIVMKEQKHDLLDNLGS